MLRAHCDVLATQKSGQFPLSTVELMTNLPFILKNLLLEAE